MTSIAKTYIMPSDIVSIYVTKFVKGPGVLADKLNLEARCLQYMYSQDNHKTHTLLHQNIQSIVVSINYSVP